MFSSNQKFIITGDRDNNLETALNCALNLFDTKIRGYSFDNNGMKLYSYPENTDVIKIEESDIGNRELLYLIVKQYLCSSKYKEHLNKMNNEFFGADGSTRQGWEIGCLQQGWQHVIYVKPFWTFYSK